jgi:hypothetical protein
MAFGKEFGEWDYEWVLANVPPHMMLMWEAKNLIEACEMVDRKPSDRWEPPMWLRQAIREHKAKERAKRPPMKLLSVEEIEKKFRR